MDNHAMGPENLLLLALLRWPLDGSQKALAASLVQSDIKWADVLNTATNWRVEATLLGNLRTHYSDAIPEWVSKAAADRERRRRAETLSRALITIDMVAQLTAEGIEAIVLKGPAIGSLGYGDVSLRAFGDIDLLVRRHDLQAE
jgi:hypothetical protein